MEGGERCPFLEQWGSTWSPEATEARKEAEVRYHHPPLSLNLLKRAADDRTARNICL